MNRKIRPLHPGDIIRDILDERDISISEFCDNDKNLKDIVLGTRPITHLVSEIISEELGISSQLLMNLQRKVDIWDSKSDRIGSNEYEI